MSKTQKYVIVAGVDQSESGDRALEHALRLGAAHGSSEVHAISVVSFLSSASGAAEYALANLFPGIPLEQAYAELERHVERKLEVLRERLTPQLAEHLPRTVCHIRVDAPAKEIAQLAADIEADLVIVGTHGRRGVARALLGSVAETTVRLAPCPVMVVRPKQISPEVSIAPPCPECVKARVASGGSRYWCEQHSTRHGQRHTYYTTDRISADGSFPLVFHA
jgi:nucleotide-binding universal stress UspA family protein